MKRFSSDVWNGHRSGKSGEAGLTVGATGPVSQAYFAAWKHNEQQAVE
jgi:hypothetical protein